MEVRDAANAKDVKFYTTDRLREEFHIGNLFPEDDIKMVYSHIDRIIVIGMADAAGHVRGVAACGVHFAGSLAP